MRHLLITAISFASFLNLNGQGLDFFDEQDKSRADINYLFNFGEFTRTNFQASVESLSSPEFVKSESDVFYAADTFMIDEGSVALHSWFSSESEISLQLITGDYSHMDSLWKSVGRIGRYTGYSIYRQGNYYMRSDSTKNNIVNLLFKKDSNIISLYAQLPFITHYGKERTKEQDEYLGKIMDQFMVTIRSLADYSVPQKFNIYRNDNEQLAVEERIRGFNDFWNEVKYNFAFFHQVPDLDWEQVYVDYLPLFMEEQSNIDYYRLLEKLCALLEDGHTNIYPPMRLYDYPLLSLRRIEGQAVVQNISQELESSIPRGTVIQKINNETVEKYISDNILPYISSSTDYIKLNRGAQECLRGAPDTEVSIEFVKPDGSASTATLTRNRNTSEFKWAHEWPGSNKLLEFKEVGPEIAYVNLTSFSYQEIVQEFEKHLDTLKSYENFIIDLRENGGGNSGNGYDILKYFTDEPFATSKWSTREHLPSFKAWGSSYKNRPDDLLDEWQLKAKNVANGQHWFTEEPDTIQAEKLLSFRNFLVLIGNNTASAAEDFLIALDDLGFGVLIGDNTYGSTGQPLFIRMPSGGNARICTKKDTYPDGREFVGYGISPDIEVKETIEDFLSEEDAVLEAAIRHLKN